VQGRAGGSYSAEVLTGPFHTVAPSDDDGGGGLQALCGAPVIVATPVWWPPAGGSRPVPNAVSEHPAR
jgi:hypothetical protein